jgi:hypothetical protein
VPFRNTPHNKSCQFHKQIRRLAKTVPKSDIS